MVAVLRHGLAILGAGGRLGRVLWRQAHKRGVSAIGFDRQGLDITRPDQILDVLRRSGCAVVVNLAAYTQVDLAEGAPDQARAVNALGAENVAEACRALDLALIHLSTDYVFDGRSAVPYVEESETAALSVYGAAKAEGERRVRGSSPRHVILRVSWLYGDGHGFPHAIAGAVAQGRPLRVVADQKGAPTHVEDVAEAILFLAERAGRGLVLPEILHFAAQGATSRYDVAGLILDQMSARGFGRVPLYAVSETDLGLAARRPSNSLLDCSRYDRLEGPPRAHWREGIAAWLSSLGRT